MLDVMKKMLLAGVGMTLLTKDKVEELAREVAKSADLSREKGQEFIDEAVARAKKGREELNGLVERAVNEAVGRANLPTRKDIAELQARLARLEQMLTPKPPGA
jgi:polyhydroxyalkanoate synthesis regulator phasin